MNIFGRNEEKWAVAFYFLCMLADASHAQSGEGIEEAKQHYQNAKAAIAKSDWSTAKTELLEAEKFAPRNALVHYDLALAYLHTGDKALSQSEASTAIKLGLAGAEKDTAERLLREMPAGDDASKAPKKSPKAERVAKSPTEDAEGRTWLFCQGEGKKIYDDGRVESAKLANVYVFNAKTEELWQFNYDRQELSSAKGLLGEEIEPNLIVVGRAVTPQITNIVTINRTTLAYYDQFDAGGQKTTVTGQCQNISPDQVKAKPAI